MKMPPYLIDMRVGGTAEHPFRLWLPLFLLWPLLALLVLPVLTLAIIADVALYVLGQEYHSFTLLLLGLLETLGEIRGLVVRVNGDRTTVDMTIL